jgi:hypothetical protein
MIQVITKTNHPEILLYLFSIRVSLQTLFPAAAFA